MNYTLCILGILSFLAANGQSSTVEIDSAKANYKNDISVSVLPFVGSLSFSGQFNGRMYLEYRRQIMPSLYLKANISTRDGDNSVAAFDVYVDDTTRLRPTVSYYKSYGDIRLGVDKEFNDGLINLGGSLIFGKSTNGSYNETSREYLDTTYNVWLQDMSNCTHTQSSIGFCDRAVTNTSFLDLGLSLNVNLNLYISERWGVHVKYEPQFKYRFRQSYAESIHGEPYLGIVHPVSYQRASHQEFRHNVDLNLRFKF